MARRALGVAVVACVGVAAGAIVGSGACLPDLSTINCGNGHIDPHESCDPGVTPNPGCTSLCEIYCPAQPGDGNSYFFDQLSNHCYVSPITPSVAVQTYAEAQSTCQQLGGHIVTYVDEEEVADVAQFFAPVLPSGAAYWVGLSGASAAGPFASESAYEPGWNVSTQCSGCFLHGLTPGSSPPVIDAGADVGASPAILAASRPSNNGVMEVIGQGARERVVCEREPPGARSSVCADGAQFCFSVQATSKRYLYHPAATTALAAEAYCRGFLDAGTGRLVVLESRPEREQVIYELRQLHLLQVQLSQGGTAIPAGFWIGLSGAVTTRDGGVTYDAGAAGALDWVWDDGVRASASSTGSRPAVWGNHEPPAKTTLPSRAYIQFVSTYDTGLASTRSNNDESQTFPFVCEY
jgi:hypothetical protein